MTTAKERMRGLWARQKAKGMKRMYVWVRPEDVVALQEASFQPEALKRLQREVRADLTAEIAQAMGRDMREVAAFCKAVEGFLAKRDVGETQVSEGEGRK